MHAACSAAAELHSAAVNILKSLHIVCYRCTAVSATCAVQVLDLLQSAVQLQNHAVLQLTSSKVDI
jgi:hypothetical protein